MCNQAKTTCTVSEHFSHAFMHNSARIHMKSLGHNDFIAIQSRRMGSIDDRNSTLQRRTVYADMSRVCSW